MPVWFKLAFMCCFLCFSHVAYLFHFKKAYVLHTRQKIHVSWLAWCLFATKIRRWKKFCFTFQCCFVSNLLLSFALTMALFSHMEHGQSLCLAYNNDWPRPASPRRNRNLRSFTHRACLRHVHAMITSCLLAWLLESRIRPPCEQTIVRQERARAPGHGLRRHVEDEPLTLSMQWTCLYHVHAMFTPCSRHVHFMFTWHGRPI